VSIRRFSFISVFSPLHRNWHENEIGGELNRAGINLLLSRAIAGIDYNAIVRSDSRAARVIAADHSLTRTPLMVASLISRVVIVMFFNYVHRSASISVQCFLSRRESSCVFIVLPITRSDQSVNR